MFYFTFNKGLNHCRMYQLFIQLFNNNINQMSPIATKPAVLVHLRE